MSRLSNAVNMAFRKVSHVIFDMDGLILDTEPLYTKAISNIIEPYNKEFTWDFKVKLMGMTGPDAAKLIIETYDLPMTCNDYLKLAHEQYMKLFHETELLPDSESLYYRIYSNIIKSFGKTYSNDVRMKILGRIEKESFKIIVDELGLPCTTQEFAQIQEEQVRNLLSEAALMPGAERLIRHLHKSKIPIAVATSSGKESVEIKTQKHKQIFSLFDHLVMAGSDPEVKKGKPNPDIFLIAASRFIKKPQSVECLVFEDAPNGVQAAISAGMQCVMVPDSHLDRKHCKQATLVLNSLEEFKPQDFGLPPF